MSTLFAENHESFNRKIAETHKRVFDLEADKRRLSEALTEANQKIDALERKLAESAAEMESVRSDLGIFRGRAEHQATMEGQVETLRNQLNKTNDELSSVLDESVKLADERDALKLRAVDAETERDGLRGEIDPFRDMIDSLKARQKADLVIAECLSHLSK